MRLYQHSHILFSDQILILLYVYLLCLFITLYWFIVYLGTCEGQRKQRAEVSFSLALCILGVELSLSGKAASAFTKQVILLVALVVLRCLSFPPPVLPHHFCLVLMSLSYFTLQQIISSDELSHCWTYYCLFVMYALESCLLSLCPIL